MLHNNNNNNFYRFVRKFAKPNGMADKYKLLITITIKTDYHYSHPLCPARTEMRDQQDQIGLAEISFHRRAIFWSKWTFTHTLRVVAREALLPAQRSNAQRMFVFGH